MADAPNRYRESCRPNETGNLLASRSPSPVTQPTERNFSFDLRVNRALVRIPKSLDKFPERRCNLDGPFFIRRPIHKEYPSALAADTEISPTVIECNPHVLIEKGFHLCNLRIDSLQRHVMTEHVRERRHTVVCIEGNRAKPF